MMQVLSREMKDNRNIEKGNAFDYQYYLIHKFDSESDNYCERRKSALVNLILYVMQNELTNIQCKVVTLVKIRGLKSKDVAIKMGVNPSTISRELKLAQNKFDRAYEHYLCLKQILCNQ